MDLSLLYFYSVKLIIGNMIEPFRYSKDSAIFHFFFVIIFINICCQTTKNNFCCQKRICLKSNKFESVNKFVIVD